MKKILITGNAGAGKTTLSCNLAKILKRNDVYNLDKIVWKPRWISADKSEKEKGFLNIINHDTWIVDGVSKTILAAADTIIFLDYPRHVCYWRSFSRNLKYLFRSRPDLPERCPEILIVKTLIKIIWNFENSVKPDILKHLTQNSNVKNIFHIINNKQLLFFLKQFKIENGLK